MYQTQNVQKPKRRKCPPTPAEAGIVRGVRCALSLRPIWSFCPRCVSCNLVHFMTRCFRLQPCHFHAFRNLYKAIMQDSCFTFLYDLLENTFYKSFGRDQCVKISEANVTRPMPPNFYTSFAQGPCLKPLRKISRPRLQAFSLSLSFVPLPGPFLAPSLCISLPPPLCLSVRSLLCLSVSLSLISGYAVPRSTPHSDGWQKAWSGMPLATIASTGGGVVGVVKSGRRLSVLKHVWKYAVQASKPTITPSEQREPLSAYRNAV